ncbi:MAG: hypothetical protein BAJALOKI1v1_1850003 [Promethearchaeota archaeon]|nr:MAG: hypothetical protein BAJALOKI1v1_1850003 [Candidatus Lokiarchaeota archaeon]
MCATNEGDPHVLELLQIILIHLQFGFSFFLLFKVVLITFLRFFSKITKKSIIDTLREIIEVDGLAVFVVLKGMSEKDVRNIAKHPLVMVGSDDEVKSREDTNIHLRYYGTFPRFLREMVFEHKLLSLEEAIKKMTSFPANKFHLKKRGLLKEDNFADITLFDSEQLRDNATLKEPNKPSEGIIYVIVNGKIVYKNGKLIENIPGKLLESNCRYTVEIICILSVYSYCHVIGLYVSKGISTN